jgi:hypothetical protein
MMALGQKSRHAAPVDLVEGLYQYGNFFLPVNFKDSFKEV